MAKNEGKWVETILSVPDTVSQLREMGREMWVGHRKGGTTFLGVHSLPVDEQNAPSWQNASVFTGSTLFSQAQENDLEARLIPMKILR